jgi:hypothetical protein
VPYPAEQARLAGLIAGARVRCALVAADPRVAPSACGSDISTSQVGAGREGARDLSIALARRSEPVIPVS